jgi:hypothetical protein
MHDILIGGLIAIIVIAQILIAILTSKKIKLYKNIVPEANDFETVKVFVPENQIKTVTVEHIFKNLLSYSNIAASEIQTKETLLNESIVLNEEKSNGQVDAINYKEEFDVDHEAYINEVLDFNEENDFEEELNFNEDDSYDDITELLWVTNGYSEQKIYRKQLAEFESNGWTLITD